MVMRYTWDPKKNAANVRKHRITFDAAVRAFENFIVEGFDERFEYDEIRETAIGFTNSLEIYIVFTEIPEEERRIISARPATREEREIYWNARRRHDRG